MAPEDDVADGETPVPEDDPFAVAFACRTGARDDLADLGMHMLAPEAAVLDEAVEGAALAALAPVIDDHLVGGQRQSRIDRHDPAIGDEESARLDPVTRDDDL